MEITFNELRAKEIVNIYDGKRLGRAQDIAFEKETGKVLGIIVPGLSKFLRKADDIFIPIEQIRRIGDDVILVTLSSGEENLMQQRNVKDKNNSANTRVNYVRYKRTSTKLK